MCTTNFAKTLKTASSGDVSGTSPFFTGTSIYTQLVNFESDEYYVRVAKKPKEKCELIEAGFEHVAADPDGTMYFRKRK